MKIPLLIAVFFLILGGVFASPLLWENGIEPGDPSVCEAPSGKRCWWVDASAPEGGNGNYATPYNSFEQVVGYINVDSYVQGQIQGGDYLYVKGLFYGAQNQETTNKTTIRFGRGTQCGTPTEPTVIKSWRNSPRAIFNGGLVTNDMVSINVLGNSLCNGIRIQNIEVTQHGGRGILVGEWVTWADVVSVVAHDGVGDYNLGTGGGVLIRMADTFHNMTVRNSLFYNNKINYGGQNDNNVGGLSVLSEMVATTGSRIYIYNNEFYNEIHAIRHKHPGNIWTEAYNNTIRDSMSGFYGRARYNDIHHNLFFNLQYGYTAETENQQGNSEAWIRSNTMYNVSIPVYAAVDSPTYTRIIHFNDNIVKNPFTTTQPLLQLGLYTGQTVSLSGWTWNNNLYHFTPSAANFLIRPPGTNYNFSNAVTVLGDTTSRFIEPLLTDPANGDFSLQASSPAINAGTNGIDIGAILYTAALTDATPPTATITAPITNQVLETGTTSTSLTVTTNEAATCRWSSADVTYANMPTVQILTGTESTSHTASLSPLVNGTRYTIYVSCIDTAGNSITASTNVTFSVAKIPYPNRPADFTTVLVDYGFDDAIPTAGAPYYDTGEFAYGWGAVNSGGMVRDTNQDGPQSPPNAIRWDYTTACCSGTGVGRLYRTRDFSPRPDKLYISFWIKHDANFEWNTISNKLLYLYGDGDLLLQSRFNNEYLVPYWNSGSPIVWSPTNNVIMPLGQWVQVEYLIDSTNGRVQLWMDGIQTLDRTIPNLEGNFNLFTIDSTWGGGGTKTRNSQRWMDHIFVATTSTGGSTPPAIRPGDLNGDGVVNINDVILIIQNFKRRGSYDTGADINSDGTVNIFDMVLLGKNWGGTATSLAEPTFIQGIDSLIDQENFDAYASITGNLPKVNTKYSIGRTVSPSGEYGYIAPQAESTGIITLTTPGRGNTGKATRLSYGGTNGASDIILGSEGNLDTIGELEGALPIKAGPYTHFILTTWIRTSQGADPAAYDESGIKGIMIWHNGGQRYEHNPTRLNYRFGRWSQTRWNYVGGYPANNYSGHNHWKTTSGEPPLWSLYNDGQWHRITREIYTAGDPSGNVGERTWHDGTLVFDNVNDLLTGNDPTGQPWDVYSYSNPVTHWMVFGNYIRTDTAAASPSFTIDFDDWAAWTD